MFISIFTIIGLLTYSPRNSNWTDCGK